MSVTAWIPRNVRAYREITDTVLVVEYCYPGEYPADYESERVIEIL